VREFTLAPGYGFADYLLYLDGSRVGASLAHRIQLLVPMLSSQKRS
jgi:hypothetical protein